MPQNQEIPDVASYLNNTKSIDTNHLSQMKVQTRECFIQNILENKLVIEDLNDCFNEVLPLAFLSLKMAFSENSDLDYRIQTLDDYLEHDPH